MSLYDSPVQSLDGTEAGLGDYKGKAMLIVNVASKCGFTRQYAGLQELYEKYRERGLEILGFPCNQFGNQEPGTPEQIQEFCSTRFNVSFPMFSKIDVNGPGRHPLYEILTAATDHRDEAGDVKWNFEKFLVSPDGQVVGRFRSRTAPDNEHLITAIEKALPD